MAGLSEQMLAGGISGSPDTCVVMCHCQQHTDTTSWCGPQVGDTLCEQGEKLHLAAQALEAVASGDKALQILFHMLPSMVQLDHLCTASGRLCHAVLWFNDGLSTAVKALQASQAVAGM